MCVCAVSCREQQTPSFLQVSSVLSYSSFNWLAKSYLCVCVCVCVCLSLCLCLCVNQDSIN